MIPSRFDRRHAEPNLPRLDRVIGEYMILTRPFLEVELLVA